ncbi:alpha/beta hydrolase [Nocardia carnea]|uniref:Alpha/beta hydrolase n=1 Tax=Nocardia carnea TaxID=37328 RepID=A0ABW7TJN1_9NOCA|nr:alpha/beta hydrolase [Nocardia carnea]
MTSETTPAAPPPQISEPAVNLHDQAGLGTRVTYVLARLIAKQGYRIWPLNDPGIRALALLDTAIGRLPRLPGVTCSITELGAVPVEEYRPAIPAQDGLTGATVLYLHGGGFTFCGAGTHRRVASRMAQTLGIPVYSVLYRQLPHGGVGSAVHDAYTAYRALLDRCPNPGKVVLAGDSSGGFLAAKTCELAAADGLPAPAAMIGYSPHIDLDADRRDHEIIGHDALMPVSAYRRAKRKWARGPVAPRGARSMLEADPAVFPPAFLTAARREMFEADILDFTRLLAETGRTVETHIWRGQVHAFPVLDALLPESREAMRLTGVFLRDNVFGADSSS